MKKTTFLTILTTVMLLWIGSSSLFAQATVENISIIEGTSNAVVTVTLPGAAPVGGTTVLYAITANTAVEGSDYTVPGDRIVIPQGSSTGTISIPIIGDAIEEDLEDFSISVSTDLANDSGFDNAATFWSPLTTANNCSDGSLGTAHIFETGPETIYGGTDSSNIVLEVDCRSQGFQNITTVIGVTYNVTFKASRRTLFGPNPASVTVSARNATTSALDGQLNVTRTNTVFDLSEESFNFTASGNTTRIDFTTTNTQGVGLIFDDLSIVPQTADDSATITIVDKTPGNVGANLALWLKADVDATASQWDDQSGNNHDVTAVAGQQPVLETNSLNFNPVMDFDGTNDQMTNPAAPFASGVSNETNIFFVAREDARQQNSIFGFNAGTGTGNRYQAHHIYPDGTIFFDIGNPGTNDRVSGPSGLAEGVPHVASYFNSVSGNNQAIDINGANVASDTSGEPQALGETRIGTANNGTFQYFNGDIAEFIAYDTDNSATNKQQIQSYLAIKYGITLNNGATAYVASDGTTNVWTADPTHVNDIFGIARDDASGLNQEISKSVNNGAVLTVATNTDFTTANDGSRTDLTDGQFLVLGNNGLDTNVQTTEIGPDIISGINREWKVQNTGGVGNVNLKFDGFTTNEYTLIKKNGDGDFSTGITVVGRLDDNGEIFDVTLNNDDHFTLAKLAAPGAVNTNLTLWIKANDNGGVTTDGTTIATWMDQSGSGNTITAENTPSFENDATSVFNFNPVVDFDGSTDAFTLDNVLGTGNTAYEIFAVSATDRVDDGDVDHIIAFGNTAGFRQRVAFGYQFFGGFNNGVSAGWTNDGFNTSPATLEVVTTGQPALIQTNHDGSRNREIIVNGDTPFTNTATGNLNLVGTTNAATIGRNSNIADTYLQGSIAELVVYDTKQDGGTDRQQIQSYLAIKYGITLNIGATAYLDSQGNTVWAVDATYDSDIFGIANDGAQALDQQISKSVNTGAILTLSTDTNFTTANGTHVSLTDGQYLVVGNDGASGAPGDAVNTDLETTTYYERSAREWKAVNTGTVGAINLQFDGYDDTWLLLIRTVDGNFSATTGTTATPLSATGTVATTLTGTTFFTLARLATSIEFEAATASADENAAVSNLPNLLIDGTLNEDTNIDVVINAAGTATAGTDYTFADATGDGAVTVPVNIPAGTYTSGTPIALSSLRQRFNQQNYSYPTITNGAAGQQEETFVAPFTGDYEITFSAETFNTGGAGLVRVGTTSGVTDGSFDIFDGTGDRIDETTPLKKYTFSLTQGTTYYIYSVAGGGSTMTNVNLVLDYVPPINFAITDEAIVEADETINLTLSNAQSGLVIQEVTGGALIANHVYTITNDDSATVSIDSPTVTEGNTGTTTLTFTATLTGGVQDSFTVPYALTDVSTDSDDYAAFTDANITFPANSADGATQTIVVTINGDTEVEGDETLTMTLSAPSNTDVTLGTAAGTGTITNDDSATVSIDSPTVTEGNTGTIALTFTATLTGDVQDSFTVPYALTNVTTDASDYAAFTDANITFPANSADGATQTIVVTINGDTEVEGDETLTMTLSAPSNTDVTLGTAAGTGTITNDDSATVSIDSPTVTEGNTGTTTMTFTVTLTGDVVDSFTVPYALTDGSTDSDDYAAFTDANITFPANSANGATQTIVVTVNGDTEVEGDETLTMTLSAPSNTDVTLGTAAGTGTITNDDSATVSIDSPTVTEGNTGTTTLTFTATLTGDVQDSFTVPYALTNVTTDASDYAAFTDANVTFPANSADGATQTIVVTINGDTEVEGDETLTMTLSAPSNTDVTLGTAAGTGTITNDDSATVSIDSPTVTEGNTGTIALTFTATLTGDVQDSFTVPYALTNVSTDASDYAAFTDANITFPANSADGATQTIVVTINGDTEVEGDETLTMTLSAPSNTDVTLGTAAGTGTITNDDSATVSIDSPTVTEGNTGTTTMTFTVTLTGDVVDSFTVPYALTDGSTDSDDYAAFTDANITFPANSADGATQTIVVTINGDTEVEGDETLTMTLSAPSNTDITLGTATGTGTITNDDSATVSIDSPTITEGNAGTIALTFTATLTGDVQDSFTVPYALTDGSTDSDDYAAFTNANITFPANSADGATQTIVVTINGDTEVEGDEALTMTLSAPSNTDVTLGTAAGTGTITNDDSATVSIDSPTVTEGNTGTIALTFTATLTGDVQDSFTVPYTLTNVSTDASDYAAFTDANITFPANSADGATQTIVVTINGDTEVEGDETLTMTLSAPSNTDITLGTAAGTGTITNDDSATVSIDSPTVTEGNTGTTTMTFTVTLTRGVQDSFTVPYALTDVTTDAGDYAAFTDANITFPANSADGATQTIVVTINGDTEVEGDETLTMTLSAPSNTDITLGTAAGTGTITNDDTVTIAFNAAVGADLEATGGNLPTLFVTGTVTNATTVTVTDSGTGSATGGGTDYNFTSPQVINIPAGVYDGTAGTAVVIPTLGIVDDVELEAGGETIDFALGTVTGDATLGAIVANTYTITDDDIVDVSATGTMISSADGTAVADGAETETITVQLKNAAGNNLAGAGYTVTFSVTGSAVLSSGTAVTDANGTAMIMITNTIAETVDVTATIDDDNDGGTTPQVAIVNGSPAQVVFTPDNANPDPTNVNTTITSTGPVAANGTDVSTVTVQLADSNGNLITIGGETVALNVSGNAVLVSGVTDNGNGTYTATYSNLLVESVTVTGTLNGNAISDNAIISFILDTTPGCTVNCDTDGDGDCDINCDTDGDGDCDINCDTDGDGDCDLNCDTDGDGDCDLNCDTDGDGDCDINCDTDGDGDCDLNCDTDGDGDCDLNCDTDGDGDCDLNCDTDGDGDCDLNCDTDGDGDCDLNCDTDGDGDCDLNCDTDGDGDCDLNCDTDGDGDCDLNCDTDGDGDCDLNCDTDGDGDPDVNIDTDGDGDCDLNCDTDEDGDCDLNCDTDGDGDPDVNIDTDGDGDCDLNCDTDGDGDCDLNCDTDGDGDPDVNIDTNGDGDCDLNCDTDEDGDCDLNCDNDGDGTCDIYCEDDDQDHDGDGVPDIIECPDNPNCPDTDGDGTPDYLDTDDDNDGINTIDEVSGGSDPADLDSDGDGVPDYLDAYNANVDDDGDGISNGVEDTNGDGNPYNDDCDNDGTPNFLDDDPCGITDIPKGFSPNGDGVNDTWVIPGIEAFPNHEIKLFNRWGAEVFSAIDYQNDWNGVSNGKRVLGGSGDRLPTGAYYYVIETGTNTIPPFTGWIYINY